jgi:molybdopterin synthase sulfur carrier subunit
LPLLRIGAGAFDHEDLTRELKSSVKIESMALVRVRGQLKQLAGGSSGHDLDGATVLELLRALEEAHPAVAGWVLDERGRIRRHINVFVNGEQSDAEAAVAPGDCIDVLPAISGG